MHLEFFGAAGEVTGSCHILSVGGRRILLDCGLIQGGPGPDERNRRPFPFDAAQVDAVILSHAHVDHCGRLPLLRRRGYRGTIYANPACRDLARILLADSALLAQRDADRSNRRFEAQGRRARVEPLYTVDDAMETLRAFRAVGYGQPFEVVPGVELTFRDAGHILGSASVWLRLREGDVERTLVFSGDLGQYGSPILRDPEAGPAADLVVMESTYGDRLHRDRAATLLELGEILRGARKDGGNVLIPAFAVGRSQDLLYELGVHFDAWDLGHWRIFLDSPMAIAATELTLRHRKLLRVSARELAQLTDGVRFVETGAQSQRLSRNRMPAVIISASGMATGGRVLHHLQAMAPNERHHVVFPGFQVAGTRGARLVAGEREVKIFGEMVPVRAEVSHLEGFSGHADADELMQWLRGFERAPRHCFVVHGDPQATDALRFRIGNELAWQASVPPHAMAVEA